MLRSSSGYVIASFLPGTGRWRSQVGHNSEGVGLACRLRRQRAQQGDPRSSRLLLPRDRERRPAACHCLPGPSRTLQPRHKARDSAGQVCSGRPHSRRRHSHSFGPRAVRHVGANSNQARPRRRMHCPGAPADCRLRRAGREELAAGKSSSGIRPCSGPLEKYAREGKPRH